jgi:hypothetical protein
LWIREKESLYFAALKEDVVWLKKKNSRLERKIGMPVNGSRKLIKVSHQTFAWWNLIRTRRQHLSD